MRHYVIDGKKTCSRCLVNKPVGDFPVKMQNGRAGVYPYCKPCRTEYNKEKGKERTSEYNRAANLKSKFGLTLEDFNRMLEEQGGACAICHKKSSEVLRVDHCHTTGRVRKLLCGPCNTLLGVAFENSDTLRSAIKYLEEHK